MRTLTFDLAKDVTGEERNAPCFLCSVWRFVFDVAGLTHAVTLIGSGMSSLPVTQDMVALDKIPDLWCNDQRHPTFL